MSGAVEQELTFHAHAKVNLCLSVEYPPCDGYHSLRSVFQELDLHDEIAVRVIGGGLRGLACTSAGTMVDLHCDIEGLDARDNLIFRAIDAFETAFGCSVVSSEDVLRIEVRKSIPTGGGLGGGSSDAAAMLKACARMTGISAQDGRLHAIARDLGADVAFFLHGGAALMDGRGDMLERTLPKLGAPIVLMGSDEGNSTMKVYRVFDENPQSMLDADALADAMVDDPGDLSLIASLCGNNLELAACQVNPSIRTRLDFARSHVGVLAALVSGSGATSFAICADESAAEAFAQDVVELCSWVRVCRV